MNNNEIIILYFLLIEIKYFSLMYDRSINYISFVINKFYWSRYVIYVRIKIDIFIKILIIEYFEKKKLLNYSRENNIMYIFLFYIGDLWLKL